MQNSGASSNPSSISRAAASIIGLVIIFTALLGFSLWKTTTATNETDMARTKAAIEAVVRNELSMLEGVSTDNAFWDDAYLAARKPVLDRAFVESAWGAPSEVEMQNQMYDTSAVLDKNLNARALWIDGKETDFAGRAELKSIIARLTSRLKGNFTTVASVEATKQGPRFFAISVITPLSEDLLKTVDAKNPSYLVFSRPVTEVVFAKVNRLLLVSGVRLARPGDSVVATFNNVDGQPSLRLAWNPEFPGAKAVGQVAPVLGVGLLICLALASVVLNSAWRMVRSLREQALKDSLSKLPNRRAIQLELKKSRKKKQQAALAFIDLDGFKGINDNYGHGVGDALIQECALQITAMAPKNAIVARLGGDEFAVLIAGQGGDDKLERLCARFLDRLQRPFLLGDRTVVIGASIGLAACNDGSIPASELMRRADFAMYSAKSGGKMQSSWFSPELDESQAKAHRIEMRIRDRLSKEAFDLEYQPIVNAKTHSIMGVEALIRWGDDEEPGLSPDEFIPVAEETGLIDQIGRTVLKRACTEAINWPGITLSVNISAAQLRNPHFPRIVADVLSSTGFPANRLELEVTETFVITNPDAARAQFDEIRALGVKIALDDFGTGYASVGYLRQFKFDKLKLDRSLVCDAETDEASRTLLNASIVIAHSLSMSVVAEGVETLAQAQLMNVAGSDQLQGWHFAKSMSNIDMGAAIEVGQREDAKEASRQAQGRRDRQAA